MTHSQEGVRLTIILGAGASRAYARSPYPLLKDLLPALLDLAARPDSRLGLYRHRLAYALGPLLRIPVDQLAAPSSSQGEVDRVLSMLLAERSELPQLDEAFRHLEGLRPPELAERTYWALAGSVGVFMNEKYAEDIWAGEAVTDERPERLTRSKSTTSVDQAHRELIQVIDCLVGSESDVEVVDLNYDCVLEQVHYSMGSNVNFGWDVYRAQQIVPDGPLGVTLSQRARLPGASPRDTRRPLFRVPLVKPHGDRCTFLRGRDAVFYSGGRYSQTNTGLLQQELADPKACDEYLRSSIVPPSDSDFRYRSRFYSQEERRFVEAVATSRTILSIGWRAAGTDDCYQQRFAKLAPASRRVLAIDRGGLAEEQQLRGRWSQLLGGEVEVSTYMSGLCEAAIDWVRRELNKRR